MSTIDAKDHIGRTALFSAIQGENEAVVKLLLEASLDPNCPDVMGNVALHVAVEMGSESMTLLLLSFGANVNA
ncbi:ankyrin repeat-containing domain protein [Xylariales sp. AK1849]|nr:ankyrin repeat-containing domain protein [Xylariales sp. AK1849]